MCRFPDGGISGLGSWVCAGCGCYSAAGLDRVEVAAGAGAQPGAAGTSILMTCFSTFCRRLCVMSCWALRFCLCSTRSGCRRHRLWPSSVPPGLAIGLALQGTLSNVAAGVMLILFRPIRNGDFVEVAGKMGTVKEITLNYTELGGSEQPAGDHPQCGSLGQCDHQLLQQ